mgnify:CR=1 FL=1
MATQKAIGILKKRGDMKADGKLTAKGKKRDRMTASQRAKNRAAKVSGRLERDYKYNAKTNRATLKNRKPK